MPLRDVPLPMAEKRFLELAPNAPPRYHQIPKSASPGLKPLIPQDSLIAHSVIVNQIFPRIDQVNSLAVSGELQGHHLLDTIEQVSQELLSWELDLPVNIVNTPENLAFWTSQGFGNVFVILHMNYYYLCQLLFYQFLHNSSSTHIYNPEITAQYASKCAQYATDFCNLIHLASETPGAELLNSIVGHVLTVASTVQLHTLLFSADSAQVQNSRRLLERNFQLLTRLKTYWPCIDISFSRFETFHKACLRSQDDSLFRMDQWMLKFMLEFATPLTERYEDEEDGSGDDRQFSFSWFGEEALSLTTSPA